MTDEVRLTADDPTPTPQDVPVAQDPSDKYAKLQSENAQRRIENKTLKDQLASQAEKISALEPLAGKLTELETSLKAERDARALAEQKALRTEVAAKYGLPAELAARLQGATAEELAADAQALSKILPNNPNSVRVSPGNVSDAGSENRAAKLYENLTGKKS